MIRFEDDAMQRACALSSPRSSDSFDCGYFNFSSNFNSNKPQCTTTKSNRLTNQPTKREMRHLLLDKISASDNPTGDSVCHVFITSTTCNNIHPLIPRPASMLTLINALLRSRSSESTTCYRGRLFPPAFHVYPYPYPYSCRLILYVHSLRSRLSFPPNDLDLISLHVAYPHALHPTTPLGPFRILVYVIYHRS